MLFNLPMARKLVLGEKTQTRRPLATQPVLRPPSAVPYSVGDTIWVRETWCEIPGSGYWYAADWSDADLEEGRRARRRYPELAAAYSSTRWRPSIHMPRVACRLVLRITDVRLQRVQEISAADLKAEGMDGGSADRRLANFIVTWTCLYGVNYPWRNNPWVVALSFEKERSLVVR